ncbi:PDZ domain-containing protein [Candidatus Zixiibacteriota bacterium]
MRNILKITGVLALALIVIFSIGFAKSSKYSKSGWLGVEVQSVNDDIADAFDLEVDYGVIINAVVHDSPADEADLEEGDIIVAFDNQKVFDVHDLTDYLEDSDFNEEVTLTVYREDDKFDVTVELDKSTRYYSGNNNYEYKYDFPFNFKPPKPVIAPKPIINIPSFTIGSKYKRYGDNAYMGVYLTNLSKQLGEYFGVTKGRGALITEVVEDSPAEEAGIVAGDVIIGMDDEKVYEHSDVTDLLSDYEPDEEIILTILRNKQEKQVTVTLTNDEDYYDDDQDHIYFKGQDITIDIPRMSGLRQGYYLDKDDDHWNIHYDDDDIEDFVDDLEEYFEDIDEINEELDDLNDEVDDDILEDVNYLFKEIEELESELKEFDLLDNRKFKREYKKLKNEMKKLRNRL